MLVRVKTELLEQFYVENLPFQEFGRIYRQRTFLTALIFTELAACLMPVAGVIAERLPSSRGFHIET